MKGIDISHYQGVINWSILPLEYEFVIIKCTQGLKYLDPKFSTNKNLARKSGRLCGYYHFADQNDPIKEADWFLKNVGDIQQGELVVLDSETGQTPDWCLKFLNQVYLKAGFRPLLYIN
jgi:GH25 family lysozyme M1 (1,4-beta-N-acetylmuramidase)